MITRMLRDLKVKAVNPIVYNIYIFYRFILRPKAINFPIVHSRMKRDLYGMIRRLENRISESRLYFSVG